MFSKILIKLIDQAIVPALLLLVTRVTSVLVLAKYFNYNVNIGDSGFVFDSPAEYLVVNSYSVLLMLIVLTVGLLYILAKSFIFHDSHIEPGLTAHLFSLRLSSFIQTSFDLYSQGVVWLSYSYLLMFVAAVLSYFGLLFTWVFVVSFILTVVSTVLLVFDVENEVKIHSEPFDGALSALDEVEEYVMTIGGPLA